MIGRKHSTEKFFELSNQIKMVSLKFSDHGQYLAFLVCLKIKALAKSDLQFS